MLLCTPVGWKKNLRLHFGLIRLKGLGILHLVKNDEIINSPPPFKKMNLDMHNIFAKCREDPINKNM